MSLIIRGVLFADASFRDKDTGVQALHTDYLNDREQYIFTFPDNVTPKFYNTSSYDEATTELAVIDIISSGYEAYRLDKINQAKRSLLNLLHKITIDSDVLFLEDVDINTNISQTKRNEAIYTMCKEYLEDGSNESLLTIYANELDVSLSTYVSTTIDEIDTLNGLNNSVLLGINLMKDIYFKQCDLGIVKDVPNLETIIKLYPDDITTLLSNFNTELDNSGYDEYPLEADMETVLP